MSEGVPGKDRVMNNQEFLTHKYDSNLQKHQQMTSRLRILKLVAWLGWAIFVAHIVNESGLARIVDPNQNRVEEQQGSVDKLWNQAKDCVGNLCQGRKAAEQGGSSSRTPDRSSDGGSTSSGNQGSNAGQATTQRPLFERLLEDPMTAWDESPLEIRILALVGVPGLLYFVLSL